MGEFIKLEDGRDDGVAVIRLDRPPMNAINRQVTAELGEIVRALADRSDLGAVVLWGGPKIFAAGADVKEFADFGPAEAEQLSHGLNDVLLDFGRLPQVTIAAINGYALGGGCEVALAADFRVVGDDAILGQPEILLGVIPGAGGTQRLTRIVGVTKAKELIFTGRTVKAAEAVEIGLASAVHPAADLYEAAMGLAARYAAGPAAIAHAKRAIDEGIEQDLATAVATEAREFGAVFGTEDKATGIASFLENGPGKATFDRR